jgi:hypothetical protein
MEPARCRRRLIDQTRTAGTMRPRSTAALMILAALLLNACSRSGSVQIPEPYYSASDGSGASATPLSAAKGTLILEYGDYSYTPVGGTPTGFQSYGDGPIHVAVGTSVVVYLGQGWVDPISSDRQVIQPVHANAVDRDGAEVVTFKAVLAGAADIISPPQCPKIRTLPCYGTFQVSLDVS